MERGPSDQSTSRFMVNCSRRSKHHLVAEIRVTTRGKQVQFYWAGATGGQQGAGCQVWRTTYSAPEPDLETTDPLAAEVAREVFISRTN